MSRLTRMDETFSAYTVEGGVLHLSVIRVRSDVQGHGLGSQALDQLCALADERGWAIELTPSDVFGTPLSRLVPWYFSRGFLPISGTDRMRRPARTA